VADDSAGNGGDGIGSIKSAPELFLNRVDDPLLYAFNDLASFREYEKMCATTQIAVKQLDEHLGGNVTQHPAHSAVHALTAGKIPPFTPRRPRSLVWAIKRRRDRGLPFETKSA
jgi:hypothetical protein